MNSPEVNNPYLLSPEENRAIFVHAILPSRYEGLLGAANPVVYFFGGQPGAGKSRVESEIRDGIVSVEGLNTVADISIDDYRAQHPAYNAVITTDENNLGAYTNQDCWLWSEQAKEYVLQLKPFVLQEGTLRDPNQTLTDVNRYLENGYTAELHIIAAHEFVSRYRYLDRYVGEVEDKGYGRLVPRSFHDEAYRELPQSVSVMTDSQMFSRVVIHDADGHVIEQVQPDDVDAARRVLAAIADQRDISKLDKQTLLRDVDELIERAQNIGRANVVEQLELLRHDVTVNVPDITN